MATQVETILNDLTMMRTGTARGMEQLAQADDYVGRSISAAAQGGFAAMAAQLNQVRQGIREARTRMAGTGQTLVGASGPIGNAPKELSAEQVVSLLSPVTATVDQARQGYEQVRGMLPDLINKLAVVANRNPALLILNTLAQQVLGILIQHANTCRQHLDQAIADANRARSGGA